MAGLLPHLSHQTPHGKPLKFNMPSQDESENQPAQTMESVLKTRREKLAKDKLGIQPENDPFV